MKKLMLTVFAGAVALVMGSYGKTVTISELPTTVTAADAIVVDVGDTIELPTLAGSSTYKNLSGHRFLGLEGTTVTAIEPGFGAVQCLDGSGTLLSTVMIFIKPDMQEGGRVFIYNFSSDNGWNNPASWIPLEEYDGTGIPGDPKDVIFVPITTATDKELKVDGEQNVQDIFFGSPFDAKTNFRLSGKSSTGCRLNIWGIPSGPNARPGTFMVAAVGTTAANRMENFCFGGSGSGATVTLGCSGDVRFDLGGRSSNPNFENSDSCIIRMQNDYGFIDIPEGRRLSCVNGHSKSGTFSDGQPGNERCWGFTRGNAITGNGVFEIAASGEFYLTGTAFSAFEGEIVDSMQNVVTKFETTRSGPCWSSLHDMTNATLTIAGYVPVDLAIKKSVGVFTQGNNGWGAAGFVGNGIPYKGVNLDGGYLMFHKFQSYAGTPIYESDGVTVKDYEIYNQTANLNVRRGLTYVYIRDSPGTGEVMRRFTAESITHAGSGSLIVQDARSWNGNTTARSLMELGDVSAFYVGNTADVDLANDVFPVVPWLMTYWGDSSPWWGYVGADGIMCRGGVRTNTNLSDVADPRRNALIHSKTLAVTADTTVNSLVLSDLKGQSLAGHQLTISSGGLILRGSSGLGTADGGESNGSVVFPARAYVWSLTTSATSPSAIWSPITAPNGFVVAGAGYLRLGGDQTGIDGDIVVNGGQFELGDDAGNSCQIDVPITLVGGNASLLVRNQGTIGDINLMLETVGGFGPKLTLPEGQTEDCQKFYIDGVSMPVGTYGATGSGADNIDDVHFTGTGVLNVLRDDLGWPILENVAVTDYTETTISVGGHAVLGSGASELKLYTLLQKDGETAVATNLFRTATEEDDFTATIADLDDGTLYHIAVYASNLVPSAVQGEDPLFFDAISDWMDVTTRPIAHIPEITVDAASIEKTASIAQIPWYLVSEGYQDQLVELKLVYGTAVDALDKVLILPASEFDHGDQLTTLTGLTGNTTYYAKFWAKNNNGDGEEGETEVFSFTTMQPFAVSGAAEAFRVNGDVVARFNGAGTLQVPENVTARVLVVGGGGAGGYRQGGGGGGGQVVDEEIELAPGVYNITAGVGGIAVSSDVISAAANGGESSIAQGDNIIVSAMGGGAGGNYSNTEERRNGQSGANGGGATTGENQYSGVGGVALAVGGSAGGNASGLRCMAGGGGGASGAGEDGSYGTTASPYYAQGGNGGDGLASDITGATVLYGAGGGGGVYSADYNIAGRNGANEYGTPGDGGNGGGGNGGGGNQSLGNYRAATAGQDGVGAGGGGGGRYNDSESLPEYRMGANGGSGVVIVRFVDTLPTPAVTIGEVKAGVDSAMVDLTLDSAGWNQDAADVVVTLGETEVFSGSFALGETKTIPFTGLTANTDYTFAVEATNAQGETGSANGTFKTIGAIAGTGGTITRDGDYVVHTFLASGTLTIPSGVRADVLLVGGGGAGGYTRGGGGGAGGLVYNRGVALAGGTYTVTVGAGGVPTSANKTPGGQGGDSVLAFAGADVFRAVGGGGGANYNDTDGGAYAGPGGSSGGNTRTRMNLAACVEGQGNYGGAALINNGSIGGGGGGAGTPGKAPSRYYLTGGNGGDGREIGITGENIWYAGGGGGGTYYKNGDGTWQYAKGGVGGLGGGGVGGGGTQDADYVRQIKTATFVKPTAGVDGLGGGGGGGGSRDGNDHGGAAGGSGVVIVRYYAPESAGAMIAPTRVEGKDSGVIEIDYAVLSLGAGIAKIEAVYGLTADQIIGTKTIANDVTADGAAVLAGVLPGTTYCVTLKVTDANGAVKTSYLGPVSVPKRYEDAASEFGSHPGLWQAKQVGDAKDFTFDILANETRRLENGAVMATIYGNPGVSGTWTYKSPIDGFVNEWEAATVFGYSGFIHLRKGAYQFAVAVDDYGVIRIGGDVVAEAYYSCGDDMGTFVAPSDGWYPIDVRIGNVSGGAGYYNVGWYNHGFCYRAVTPGFNAEHADWIVLKNSELANGTWFDFLRTSMPGRDFGVEVTANAGDAFTATAHILAGGEGDALYVCRGATAANELDGWTTVTKIADLAATAVDQPVSLTDLGEGDAFIRLAIVGPDGKVTWSETFKRDVFGVPEFGEIIIDALDGESVTFAGRLTLKGGTGATYVLHYGTDPDVSLMLSKDITSQVAADGTFAVTLDGLTPGTKYWWYVTAESAGGAKVETPVVMFEEPGSCNIGNLVIDNTHGRELHLRYELTALGAGEGCTVTAYARKWDPKGSGAWTVVGAKNMTNVGADEIVWNASDAVDYADVWQVYVSAKNNSASGTSWTKDVSTQNVAFYDNATYTWTGAAGNGLWSDAGNWSTDATCDRAGWPYCGATVIFPAGCDATVTMPAMGMLHMKSIQLKQGTAAAPTKVTLVGDGNPENFISVEKPDGTLQTNGSFAFGQYCEFTLDGVAIMNRANSGGFDLGANGKLHLKNGAALTVNGETKLHHDNTTVILEGDSTLESYNHLYFGGENSTFIIDNSYVEVFLTDNDFCCNQDGKDTSKIILRGDHPRIQLPRCYPNSNSNSAKFYLEIPRGGYAQAPIRQRRQDKSATGYKFSENGSQMIKFFVSPDSPALAYAEDLADIPVIDWFTGVNKSRVTTETTLEGATVAWTYGTRYGNSDATLSVSLTSVAGTGSDTPKTPAEPEVTQYGGYTIYKWTDVKNAGLITFDQDVEADLLVVGGGGAGGWSYTEDKEYQSGGGGAGGMIYKQGITIPAGTYPIYVGAGGDKRVWDYQMRPVGKNGYDSFAFGYRAFGGGGGSAIMDWNCYRGQPGGSGGGVCNGNTNVGLAIDPAQGNNGGSGVGENCGSGGGGAGSVGGNGDGTDPVTGMTKAPGNGGDGLACDISGESIVYAGGGGAGATNRGFEGGRGGIGGGGNGGGRYFGYAQDGVDGLGAGGGGAGWSRENYGSFVLYNNGAAPGGKGGDGVVILRVKNASYDATKPQVGFRTVSATSESGATVEWEYLDAGTGADASATTFVFAYGPSEDALDGTCAISGVSATGVAASPITGLGAGRAYFAKIVATNSEGVTGESEVFSFVTVAEKGDALYAGLIQGSNMAYNDVSFDIAAAADAKQVPGAIMAANRTDWKRNQTYGYVGYMWMKQGVTYYFGDYFYDAGLIKIDGTQVRSWNSTSGTYKFDSTYVPAFTGWHPIEIRLSDSSDNNVGAWNWFSYGIAWSIDPKRDVNAEGTRTFGWNEFIDPGDGSLLRTRLPDSRELSTAGALWNGDHTVLTVNVSATPEPVAVKLTACYSEIYGGDDLLKWTTLDAGTIAADESGRAVMFSDLPSEGYIRFCGVILDADGNPTGERVWSDSILISECTEVAADVPTISFEGVVPGALDAKLKVSVLSAGSGSETCSITAKLGESAESLDRNVTIASAATAGALILNLPGLLPNTTYYVSIFATNETGDNEPSETIEFTTVPLVENFQSDGDSGSGGGAAGGLYQAKKSSSWSPDFDIISDATCVITPGGAPATYCYANNGSGDHWSDSAGGDYVWPNNTTFGYTGFIYLEGGDYVFGGSMDDNGTLYIDGEAVGGKGKFGGSGWKTVQVAGITKGWHPITIYVGNGSGGAGPYIKPMGIAFNNQGVTSSSDTSQWTLFKNIDGEAPILRTAIPGRTVTLDNYAITGGALSANLTLGDASGDAYDLYVAYGDVYGYEDTNAWAHVVKIGTYDDATTTLAWDGSALTGLGTDVKYVRFFNAAAINNWSSTILLVDMSTPKIDAASAKADELWRGDAVKASCTLVYDAGGACTVVAEVSRSGDFDDVESWECVLDNETGRYGVIIYTDDTTSSRYIIPGGTAYLRFRVTGANAKSDVTSAIEFTTASASAMSATASGSASHATITLTGTLEKLGAHLEGEGTFVRVIGGSAYGDDAPLGAFTQIDKTGSFTVQGTADAVGVPCYVMIECSNGCSTATWTSRTTAIAVTPADAATYTWTGAGSDTLWSNPDNWTCSSSVNLGYPYSASAKVVFPAAAAGTVTIDRMYSVSTVEFKDDCGDAALKFIPSNVETLNGGITASFSYNCTNREIEYEDLKITDNSGDGASPNQKAGITMKLLGKTDYVHPNKFIFISAGGYFEVGPDAKLRVTTGGKPVCFGGEGVVARIDGIVESYENFGLNDYVATTTGGKLVIGGTAPSLTTRNAFTTYYAGAQEISFCVPKNGWEIAPIRPRDTASGDLKDLFNGAKCDIALSIDPQSEIFRKAGEHEIILVDWTNSKSKKIDTTHLVYANIPGRVEWTVTATQIKVTVTNHFGIKLILR